MNFSANFVSTSNKVIIKKFMSRDKINQIKYFFQRGKKGYADSDLFDFDQYLFEMIPKALRQFLKESGEVVEQSEELVKQINEAQVLLEEKEPSDESRNKEWEEALKTQDGLVILNDQYWNNKEKAFNLIGKFVGNLWW